MHCPSCSASMIRGTASVGEHLSDALLSGSADFARLFLETPDGTQTIISSGERRDAWFCQACSLAVVTPHENRIEHWPQGAAATGRSTESLTCLSCGAAIPAGKDTCAVCGWSWRQ